MNPVDIKEFALSIASNNPTWKDISPLLQSTFPNQTQQSIGHVKSDETSPIDQLCMITLLSEMCHRSEKEKESARQRIRKRKRRRKKRGKKKVGPSKIESANVRSYTEVKDQQNTGETSKAELAEEKQVREDITVTKVAIEIDNVQQPEQDTTKAKTAKKSPKVKAVTSTSSTTTISTTAAAPRIIPTSVQLCGNCLRCGMFWTRDKGTKTFECESCGFVQSTHQRRKPEPCLIIM